MSFARITFTLFIFLAPLATSLAAASDPCSFLTPAEIESALQAKITKTLPDSNDLQKSCMFELGKYKLMLIYYTNQADESKFKSIGIGNDAKDYGNIGCKVVDAGILMSTNCNRYKPRLLRISVQIRDSKQPVPMELAKSLLEKAGGRFN